MEPGSPADADPELAFRRNVTGTGNVLEAARSLGVHRVVFMSSKAAYGPFPAPGSRDAEGGVPEDYPARPQDLYGLSKLSAEALCGYYRTVLGLDVVCLRGATAYGPFKRGAGLSPPGLIGAALEGAALRATYAESAYRVVVDEYVYNADIGRAVALAVAAPRTTRLLFNIGTGVGLTTEALVEAMGRVEGLAVPVVSVVPDDDPSVDGGHLVPNQAGVLDVSAAREELGFVTGYDVEAGLAHALTILRGQ
jgi:nucleoside-diphosphate-sugar epimerase